MTAADDLTGIKFLENVHLVDASYGYYNNTPTMTNEVLTHHGEKFRGNFLKRRSLGH